MAVLATIAVVLIWINVLSAIFVGIPVAWYWGVTGYREEAWNPMRAAIRTSLNLIYAAALLYLLLTHANPT